MLKGGLLFVQIKLKMHWGHWGEEILLDMNEFVFGLSPVRL